MFIVDRRRILATGLSCPNLTSCGVHTAFVGMHVDEAANLLVAVSSPIFAQCPDAEDFDQAIELKAAKRRPPSEEDEAEDEDEEDEEDDDFDDDDLDEDDEDDDEDDFGGESLNDDYDDDDLDDDDVYYDDDDVE